MSDDSDRPDNPEGAESTQPGEIGRITPKQVAKVLTPLEREALRKQQAQYYAGEVVSDLDALVEREHASSMSGDLPAIEEDSVVDESPVVLEPKRRMRSGDLIFGLLGIALVCGLAILAMILPRIMQGDRGSEVVQTEKPYSHLHVPEKVKKSVDLSDAIGVLRIDDIPIPLRTVDARLYSSESIVELLFFKIQSAALPALKLELVFTPGTERADLGNLKEYTLFRTSSEMPFVLEKQFIRRLASHDEVSALSGVLKSGEVFRGSMKDSRLDPSSGKRIFWDLKFEATLQDAGSAS